MSKKGRVLIIDDEIELAKLIALNLRKSLEEVILAKDGEEALFIFNKAGAFDCIVCDIEMPGMPGLEIIKRIRDLDEEVPFIFYTGFASKKRVLEAIKYGAHDFIEKPNMQELVEAVHNIIYFQKAERIDSTSNHLEYKEFLKLIEVKK